MAATRLLLRILLIGCALGGVLAADTDEDSDEDSSGGEVEDQYFMSEFNLTQEQVSEIIKGFNAYDKDGDGKVTVAELGVVMRKLGHNLTETQLKKIIEQWDIDRNGTLELNEYFHMMSGETKKLQALQKEALKYKVLKEEALKKKALKKAFSKFDKDGNGLISSWELRQGMTDLGKGLCEESFDNMFRHADLNRDGFLDYNEFVEYFFKGERHSQVTHQNH